MSIHHLDAFRYLFGDPEGIFVSARTDPRTKFPHRDGICLYILEYANGFRASAWDDVWTGPVREGSEGDIYIKWRVEGTEGLAWGTIGWPYYPTPTPSTVRFTTSEQPGLLLDPRWTEVWFPDAFQGTMGALFDALNGGENLLTGRRQPAHDGADRGRLPLARREARRAHRRDPRVIPERRDTEESGRWRSSSSG